MLGTFQGIPYAKDGSEQDFGCDRPVLARRKLGHVNANWPHHLMRGQAVDSGLCYKLEQT